MVGTQPAHCAEWAREVEPEPAWGAQQHLPGQARSRGKGKELLSTACRLSRDGCCRWEEEHKHLLFQVSFGVQHRLVVSCENGLCCFAKTYVEKKTPNGGSSTGENFAPSCILLSKGNGTVGCQEVHRTQESKTVTSVSADTLIPMVIRIRDFKFRKSQRQLGFM